MTIIDEKGRLFHRINVIDFLIVLILIFIIPAYYLASRVFIKPPVRYDNVIDVKVDLDCKFIRLKPEVIDLIKAGDKEIGPDKTVIGEILWMGEPRPCIHLLNLEYNYVMRQPDPILKEIPVKLRLKARLIDDVLIYYNNVRVNVVFPAYFKTKEYNAPFVIETKNLERLD